MVDAQAYKRLLLDPCNAPLVPTPYEGGLNGRISRGVGQHNNTFANGIYFYHPTLGFFLYEATDLTTTGSLALGPAVSYTGPPGPSRPIAGCVSVSYLGAESSRSGSVSCGVVPGTVVVQYLVATQGGGGATTNIGNAATKLSTLTRMPVDRCEVNWYPGPGDEMVKPIVSYGASQANLISGLFSDTNFICVIVQNAQPGGLVQFKNVSVAELNDQSNTSGFPWTAAPPVSPPYSWKAVVDHLSKLDPEWFIDTFKKLAVLGTSAVQGYKTAGWPGALGFLTAGMAGMAIRGRMNVRSAGT